MKSLSGHIRLLLKGILFFTFLISGFAEEQKADSGISKNIDGSLPLFLRSSVDKKEIYVGDPILYSVEVVYNPKEVEVGNYEAETNWAPFELKESKPKQLLADAEGKKKIIYSFELMSFEFGELSIKPLKINFLYKGEKRQTQTDVVNVKVKRLISSSGEKADIRNIKPPLGIPAPFPYLVAGILSILILLIILYLLYKKHHQKSIVETISQELLRPCDEVALEEIEALLATWLLEQKEYKQFFTKLSEIIRVYVSRRYKIAALDMTSFEICDIMKNINMAGNIMELLAEFFNICDLVKFAKYIPERPEINETIDKAREIIEKTRSKPEPLFEVTTQQTSA